MTSKTNLNASQIDRIFQQSRGLGRMVNNVPTVSSSNTNYEPNMYGVRRDDSKEAIIKARSKELSRDQKVNGAMAHGNGISVRAGQNTNFNAPRDADKVQRIEKVEAGKVSLKKELGISGAGKKVIWKDFLKSIRNTYPELKMKDAMRIGSYMKNNGMYTMDDVNIQNISQVYEKIK